MAAFADDLKRIAMSAELVRTLSRAAEYAQAQQHDQIQLEHLLLALSEDPEAAMVLTASHVDANLLKSDVSQYLGGLTERISGSGAAPSVAPDLKRILEAAAAAAAHGRRRDINGAIVLAAIVGDGRSPAAHMLRAQGLNFDEAIRALQRAIAQPSAPSAPPAAPPAPAFVPEPAADGPIHAASAEDAIAAARQRVRRSRGIEPQFASPAVAEPTFAPEPPAAPAAEPWRDEPTLPMPAEEPPTGPPQYEAAAYMPPHDPYAAPQQETHDGGYYGGGEVPVSEPDFMHETPFEALAVEPPQPSRGRARPPLPEPGSRWPAPVAPAWREAEPPMAPPGAQPLPPPLPFGPPGGEAEASHGYAPGPQFDMGGEPSWGEPHTDAAAGYGPAGVHPLPIQDEAAADGFYPPAHAEPAHMEPGFGEPAFGPEIAAPPPHGYGGQEVTAPPSRPKRGRKQIEAAARVLGEGLPRRLRLNVPVLVEARLPKAEIFDLASALSATPGRAPQPGLAMSVRLRAPDGGIVIDASSSETHWFDARADVIQSESAHWQWTVTAMETGVPRLQLIAAVRATGADGITGDHMLPDTLVDVRVRRGFGRVLLGLAKWVFVASLGAGAALYGPAIVAAVQKLMK